MGKQVSFRWRVEGISEAVNQITGDIKSVVVEDMENEARLLKKDMIDKAARRMPSPGSYLNKFHISSPRLVYGGRQILITVSNTHQWAGAIEGGTHGHTILPRMKGHLSYYSPAYGRFIYSKGVWHPGAKAFHIFRDSIRDLKPGMVRRLQAYMRGRRTFR